MSTGSSIGGSVGTVARLRHIRTSPTKVRPVLKLIKGQDVATARDTLTLCERAIALELEKLLNAAVANADSTGCTSPSPSASPRYWPSPAPTRSASATR